MVLTPWGDSSSLRERRLHPGPGTPREEVERNQRERLFGAMVASVSEKGYEETRVADLVRLSGVSSRSFYDLFPDKRACFLAALEATIEGSIRAAGKAIGGDGEEVEEDWESLARRGADAFAQLLVAQPAASRMVLVDAYAGGPEVTAPLERAVAGFEALARETLAQSPERADIPAEMVSAYVGAVQEIARTRLLQGRQEEMPAAMAEIWSLIGSYRAPTAPLRLAGRPPAPRAESLEAHDHAERAIRAFAVVVAERGYADTTVEEVVRRASMSATTFYAHFHGKRDVLMAAIDSGGAQMLAAVQPVVRRAPDWPRSIRAGFGALFNFLASRPALARLIAVEVYAAGPAAVKRRFENLQPLEALLAKGREMRPDAPAIAVEAIAGVVYSLAYRRIRESGPESLPGLAPTCAYIALAPFVGAEEATAVANESGRGLPRQRSP